MKKIPKYDWTDWGSGGAHQQSMWEKRNTKHLMFECEKYSEQLWKKNLEEIINEMVNNDNEVRNVELVQAAPAESPVRINSYMVLCYITTSLPSRHTKEIMNLILELNRNIVYRR